MTTGGIISRRSRGIQRGSYFETSKKRSRISILCKMGRISDHRSIVGTGKFLFKRWWCSWSVQDMSPTVIMSSSTPDTASLLSLTNDLDELDWYFQNLFDQFGNMYGFLEDINHLLVVCPLEFLIFEIQQLVSFLRRYWTLCLPLAHSTIGHFTHSPSTTHQKPLLHSSARINKFCMWNIFYEETPLL